MQQYTDIPETTTLEDSRALLLANDKTALSNSSGTAFPTADLQVGMLCFRTDENKLYQLKDTTPTWVLIMDLSGTVATVPNAAAWQGGTIATRAATVPNNVPYAAALTIDAAASNIHYVGALTGNVSSLTITNAQDGQVISIRFVQDGTGGRSIALPAGAKVLGTYETGAGRVCELNIKYVAVANGVAVNRWEGSWSTIPA